ncbi:response regulator [Desulfofundulus thermobenzoicus]|uniref:Stage 0 sporulation protein A homolog n=1 Tax=Desulfofundulus thermobenzoicus TaxID=29376 RepID=A0A6N7IWP8_9FIRM|nr:response regulator [Desulfofundulus thermobenzoicus]MQL53989.1 response regulator [Desulfofundulus thermobenzoicus]
MGYGKKSILLVEDSTLTRFSSKRVLESRGYIVTEVISGEEALVRAKESLDPFDLVIVDIHLPGIDGLTTLKKIKEIPGYRYIPVMILTADAKVSMVKKAIQLGAVDYLCKPFTSEQLLQRVNKLIGHSEETPREVLESILRKEINRAKRGNFKISLVLVLRKMTNKLSTRDIERRVRRMLREIDEVIVLDDSLFALVLPLTPTEGAAVVIEKFQKWMPGKEWHFGQAVYPEDGADGKALLERAQERLNKESRKPPQVNVAGEITPETPMPLSAALSKNENG